MLLLAILPACAVASTQALLFATHSQLPDAKSQPPELLLEFLQKEGVR